MVPASVGSLGPDVPPSIQVLTVEALCGRCLTPFAYLGWDGMAHRWRCARCPDTWCSWTPDPEEAAEEPQKPKGKKGGRVSREDALLSLLAAANDLMAIVSSDVLTSDCDEYAQDAFNCIAEVLESEYSTKVRWEEPAPQDGRGSKNPG